MLMSQIFKNMYFRAPGLYGRRQGGDYLREQHQNMYII